MKHLNLKFSTWTDFAFIGTLLYIIFCLIIYCVPISVNAIVEKWDIQWNLKEITLAQFWQITNDNLKGFKFTLMILGCGVAVWLIDMFITRKLLYMTTKAYKAEKAVINQTINEYQNSKDKK